MEGADLLLVGCGKMGGALLEGWLDGGYSAARITVVEPDPAAAERHRRREGPAFHAAPDDLPAAFRPEVVVFAVKPQLMDSVVPHYRAHVRPGTVFLSIAAGRTIAYFEDRLGEAAVVRAMPNTPAAVRRGITVACANLRVDAGQRRRCQDLLSAVGEVAWVETESLLDPVTAVSGSGPAYVFLLTECLAEAGAAAGLPPDLARRLARRTVEGSAALLAHSDESPEQLRRNVTSPGGTTEAALQVLMAEETGLPALMTRAVAAAARRSRELAE